MPSHCFLPQSFVKAKGFFPSAPENVKVENLAGDVAENIYSKPWLKAAKNDGRRVVCFARMANPSSPEAYRLHITSDTLLVSAATADGFRYAWQTIGQLTSKRGIVCCDVDDAPAYKWRSLMLDVSRHFQPIEFIKKQVDIMSKYKFNRLHIHLTDAAGWRIEIKRYPWLTKLAAWRPERTWEGMVEERRTLHRRRFGRRLRRLLHTGPIARSRCLRC